MTGSALTTRPAGRYGTTTADHLFVVLAAHRGAERNLVCSALAVQRIRVATVDCIHDLRRAVQRLKPDVAVVDVGLADDRLTNLLPLVRTTGTALVALAVRDATVRAQLLLAGADDCLPGAYAPEELTARVIAVSRRAYAATLAGVPESLAAGALRLDCRARRLDVHGSEVFLTAREFDLLSYFLRHPDEVLSRERLLAEVWGYTFGSASTVTVHVRRLRSKVEVDPSRPALIQTVWGIGYRLESGSSD